LNGEHTAVAELVIDPKRSHAPENEPRVENLIDIAVLQSHLQMVKSEKIALAVIRNLSLAEDPEFIETGVLGKVLEFLMRGWKVKNEKLHRALTKFKRSLTCVVRLARRAGFVGVNSADR
jgi:polysaccharide biosynthesis transport protein